MTGSTSIAGSVEAASRGVADFPGLIKGPVGIRHRGEWIDVAFFAPAVQPPLPLRGTLDGQAAQVVSVTARELGDAPIGRTSAAATKAITATVILES